MSAKGVYAGLFSLRDRPMLGYSIFLDTGNRIFPPEHQRGNLACVDTLLMSPREKIVPPCLNLKCPYPHI